MNIHHLHSSSNIWQIERLRNKFERLASYSIALTAAELFYDNKHTFLVFLYSLRSQRYNFFIHTFTISIIFVFVVDCALVMNLFNSQVQLSQMILFSSTLFICICCIFNTTKRTIFRCFVGCSQIFHHIKFTFFFSWLFADYSVFKSIFACHINSINRFSKQRKQQNRQITIKQIKSKICTQT